MSSHAITASREEDEKIAREIVSAAFKIHKTLGPGLLERIYEVCLEHELRKRGCEVQRQVHLPIEYDGMVFQEGLKLDLLVNRRIIVELKAVEKHNALWEAQLLSHLKLLDLRVGFLINFNVPMFKQGIRRYVNGHMWI